MKAEPAGKTLPASDVKSPLRVVREHANAVTGAAMKRIQYTRYGGPDVVRLEDFDPGTPGRGQILVRVKAASVNPIDWKTRAGVVQFITGWHFPRAMGSDFSGVIQAVGPAVRRLKVGDAVFGSTSLKQSGAFADCLVTEEGRLVVKPASLSFEQAATLPIVCVTAWCGLVDKARLKPNQSVFVHGCLGGVGRATVQLALMLGATVAGSCRATTLQDARALGVNPVFDYNKVDIDAIKNRYDVVFDTAGTLSFKDADALVKRGGVVLDINPSMTKLVGFLLSARHKLVIANPSPYVLTKIADAAAAGILLPVIGGTVSLSEAIPALAELERTGSPKGKLVIIPD